MRRTTKKPRFHGIRASGFALTLAFIGGCVEVGASTPFRNCDAPLAPELRVTRESAAFLIAQIRDVDDAVWLSIPRPTGDGRIGGYLSPEASTRGSLILLLSGAGTISRGARLESSLKLYQDYGRRFRDQGYSVWAPVLSEVETYAGGEVDDVVALVDWLNEQGLNMLGAHRLYVVGYSTGATTAVFANLRCAVTAVVALAPLTEPDQLQRSAAFYRSLAALFPCNTGMRQIQLTVDTCDRVGWEALDAVSRVAELRSPMLFVQALDDFIYVPANSQDMEAAYGAALAAGKGGLAELTFYYPEHGGHFAYVLEDRMFEPVLAYLEDFEP